MRRPVAALAFLLLLVFPTAASTRRPHRRSPHREVTILAMVDSDPRRTTHRNGREFEELDVRIVSVEPARPVDSDQAAPAVETGAPVHVVHDLTCGGAWLETKPGDRLEIRGELVHPPRGPDLIHFTHSASGSDCGSGHHVDGYLRRAQAEPASTAAEITVAGDLFATSVRPVLTRHCSPCHEKGGKMYARLPFDDPAVLSSHADGARKRLKGEDLATFERWLATVAKEKRPGL